MKAPSARPWVNPMADQLRIARLHRRGLTAPEIAARLMTGYAVVARVLAAMDDSEDRETEVRPAILDNQAPIGCRWIDGDVRAGGWRYCQADQVVGSAYCADHRPRCYRDRKEVTKCAD